MTDCAQFEILLADYVDGSLPEPERTAVEQHASTCSGCRDLMNDVRGAVQFLAQSGEIEPPHELITRIAYHAPMGRIRHPLDRQGLLSRLTSKWLQPILQPRLAMGMAMTILSLAMLERCTGVRVQHIQPEDLNPVRIWGGVEDAAIRAKDRAVKYYENLRWVYEIEMRLRELREQQEAAPAENASVTARQPDKSTEHQEQSDQSERGNAK